MLYLIIFLTLFTIFSSIALWIQSLCDIELDNIDIGFIEKDLCIA